MCVKVHGLDLGLLIDVSLVCIGFGLGGAWSFFSIAPLGPEVGVRANVPPRTGLSPTQRGLGAAGSGLGGEDSGNRALGPLLGPLILQASQMLKDDGVSLGF